MGLTQIINGFECELVNVNTAKGPDGKPLLSLGGLCLGCPLRDGECNDFYLRNSHRHCSAAARGNGIPPQATARYYWFNPIVYELNKE